MVPRAHPSSTRRPERASYAAGDTYSDLGTETINGVLAGTTSVFAGAFLIKILRHPSRWKPVAVAAAANTPIAAAVMAMELLPGPEGVYAAWPRRPPF